MNGSVVILRGIQTKKNLIRRAYHAYQELLAAYRGQDIRKYPLMQHRGPEHYEIRYNIWDQVWARVYPFRGEPYDDDNDLDTEYRFDGLRGKIHELRLRPVEVRMKKAEYLDPHGRTMTGCYPPWTQRDLKKSKEQNNMIPTIHFENFYEFLNAMRVLNDFNDQLKRKLRGKSLTKVGLVEFSKIKNENQDRQVHQELVHHDAHHLFEEVVRLLG